MSTTTAPETHSPEWWAARNTGIGASEVAAIAGIGRWGSRWEIWASKVGLLPPDDSKASEPQLMGLRLEPTLARFFAEDTGLTIIDEQMMVAHREMTWVRATIDGLAAESPDSTPEDALGPVQLKYTADPPWCDCAGTHKVCPGDGIPAYYRAQGAWEMLAGDWPTMWFAALHPRGAFRVYELGRDRDDEAALLGAGRQFWFDHVLANVPPALDGGNQQATADALARAYGEGGGGAVDLTDDGGVFTEQLASIRYLKRERKALGEQIVDLENVVKATLGDAETGMVDGRPLVTWKRSTVRNIDLVALRANAAEVAAQFTVETSQRRLDVRSPCPYCTAALRAQDVDQH
ncbi:MAG: YqaJ viral recombinase family protein, partial [Acidimicrobiales bacterium]